jgi:cellulose synthase/poly-beta-1,6-N-acetylglucosamine synthase-like glycosyltransferase
MRTEQEAYRSRREILVAELEAAGEEEADDLRRRGYQVEVIHREIRTGQKGGALREGLETARGEFIAVFDADFIPAKNILTDTLGILLQHPEVGVVQTRWGHINTRYSSLTRAQAVSIDGHFMIEQVARDAAGLLLNFNGTAGVWRKSCILDAGNWQDDTLTEDLDLSYRAQLKGWRITYRHDIENPSELPAQINAYKSQQFRWAKGSIQTALKLGREICRSDLPLWKKIQGLLHTTYYSVHPLLVVNILLIFPVMFILREFPSYRILPLSFLGSFFGIAVFVPPLFCAFSQYLLYKDWKRRLSWINLTVFLGTGIALNNTRAILEALFKKKTEFVRTPKFGIKEKKEEWRSKKYRTRFSSFHLPELLLILYLILGMYVSLRLRQFYIMPYLIYYFISFGFVFFLSLSHGLGKAGNRKCRRAFSRTAGERSAQ